MKLRLIGAAVTVLALGTASCTTIKEIAGLSVNQQSIAVAVQAFDAIEVSAAQYKALPVCAAGQTFIKNACKSVTVMVTVQTAITKGRAARDSLWASAKANPTGVGLTAAYQAFVATTASAKSALATAQSQ